MSEWSRALQYASLTRGDGDYSFEVFNDDSRQRPLPMVSGRARQSVKWITGLVSRRSLPARKVGV